MRLGDSASDAAVLRESITRVSYPASELRSFSLHAAQARLARYFPGEEFELGAGLDYYMTLLIRDRPPRLLFAVEDRQTNLERALKKVLAEQVLVLQTISQRGPKLEGESFAPGLWEFAWVLYDLGTGSAIAAERGSARSSEEIGFRYTKGKGTVTLRDRDLKALGSLRMDFDGSMKVAANSSQLAFLQPRASR